MKCINGSLKSSKVAIVEIKLKFEIYRYRKIMYLNYAYLGWKCI